MKVMLVFSDQLTTRFMQHADMFEPFKVAVMSPVEAEVVDDWGSKHIEAIQKDESKYKLVAAVGKEFLWKDPDVKVVSFGNGWTLLDEYVTRLRGLLG